MSTAAVLHLLCGGAAQGLVQALQPGFENDTGATLQARFGAVGAMKEALSSGQECDVFVATQAMVDVLTTDGRLQPGSSAALGRVRTGIAVPSGAPRPDVATPEALKATLLAASAVYFPDPVRATAGIHFDSVLRELGVHDVLQPRCRTFPNGATSMRELAAAPAGAIGCTQISEILYSDGVELVGALPSRFELATVYTAAVRGGTSNAALATRLVALLAGSGAEAVRAACGFEPFATQPATQQDPTCNAAG